MKNTGRIFLTSIVILAITFSCKNTEKDKQVRIEKIINTNWTFNYFPDEVLDTTMVSIDYDDSEWPAIAVPHTWQTYETTGDVHPFIKDASERDNPYWWYGWGVYRKTFSLDSSLQNKKVFVELDGVQKYSRLYLNGKYVGDHKGGFTSFYFDLTPYVNWEGENIMAVAVNNKRNDQFRIPPMIAGNWNVYGGIYRDVRIVIKDKLHIPYQGSYKHEGGTFITTPNISKEKATVAIKTWIKNEYEEDKQIFLISRIFDPNGKLVKEIESESTVQAGQLKEIFQSDQINNPQLWSPENPLVYKVQTQVKVGNEVKDDLESPLGFRWFHWDYEEDNLYVNGVKTNILGTNRHQEYPWLGDAHPKWIAKMDMHDIRYNLGHNFMRLTHYPNDKYLYQLADSMGIVTVEEVPNIKDIDFSEEVQEQNVREMIRRDRNHPSIFFWSMGNETSDGADSKWAWEEDTTRIIHLRKGHDGGEYVQHTHQNLDMENLLRVTIRGWFDVDDAPEGFTSTPKDGQHSSNETWQHQQARIQGGSVRGILGKNCNAWLYEDHGADREYKNCILKHINPKGWVDMYRQPKYLYWLTKANYTKHPTLFVHPHFWREKYVGQKKDIVVDSNLDEVELFVNGKSVGVLQPDSTNFYTVTFKDVQVENGILKAVGKHDSKTVEYKVAMPSKPAKLTLSTEQKEIVADRAGVAIVTANILDENGNSVFDANNTLTWEIEGPGKLVGPSTYESDIMKHEEWEGVGYTVVPVGNLIRSTTQPGEIKVTVKAEGLESASVIIKSRAAEDENQLIKEKLLSDEGRGKVVKNPEYENRIFIIEELFAVTENQQLEGSNKEEYKNNLRKFIEERNHGLKENSIGYKVLLDVLANKLVLLKGTLIADDFNFLRTQFNEFRMLERAIDSSSLPVKEKERLKEGYAHSIIRNSEPLDVKKELGKLAK